MTADVNGGTEYVVLRQSDNGNWREDGKVVSRDANTAIRKTYESHANSGSGSGGPSGPAAFVAVPARSWNPVKVTPKVETTLILEEAK